MTGRETPRPLSMLAKRAHRKAVRRRWVKRVIVGGALLLVVTAAGVYAGRGPLTRAVALSRLESALGYEAVCESAELLPNGRVSLPGLELLADGIDGDAGVVVSAARVELAVDWVRAVFAPASAVLSVRLIDPVVRVSVDIEDGTLNLGLAGSGGAGLPSELPPVSVENATLVFGEHGDGWFSPMHSIAITGAMRPERDTAGVYEVNLVQVDSAGGAPAVLGGVVDLGAGEGLLTLRDVDLSALRSRGEAPPVETLLRKLRVSGRAPTTTLSYASDGSFEVGVELESVDVVAPVPVLNADTPGGGEQPLRLSGVTGRLEIDQDGIHADFFGLFEDVDARVVVETAGYNADADVSAEIVIGDYRVGPSPGLLPFAPSLASEVIKRYSGPEAVVSGRVRLARESGEAVVSGILTWREGRAAFEDFAYPISEITGRMTFDRDGIYVTDLRGVGPTGAEIVASVSAVPPGDDAKIVVRVEGTGLPIDEHLFTSIPGQHTETASMLFAGAGGDGFEIGGVVDVAIDVVSLTGDEGPWEWEVLVTSDSVGMSAVVAPYPMVLHDFSVRLDGERVYVGSPEIEGPTGMMGSGALDFPLWDDGSAGIGLVGEFDAEGVPIDGWLIGALRGWIPEVPGMLEKLGATGVIKTDGRVVLDDAGESIVVGTVGFDGVSLRARGTDAAALSGLTGTLNLEESGVDGFAVGDGPDGALVTVAGAYDFEPEGWDTTAVLTGVVLDERVVEFVSTVSAPGGEALQELIEDWQLVGEVDGTVTGLRQRDEQDEWVVEVDGFESVTAVVGGERVRFADTDGRILVDALGGDVRFEEVQVDLVGNGGSVGVFAIDGTVGGNEARLVIEGNGVRVESAAVRGLIERWGGAEAEAMFAERDPSGLVDLSLIVTQGPDGELAVSGEVVPGALAMNRDGERVAFDRAEGSVGIEGSDVRFNELRLYADGWDVLLDGAYSESEGYDGAVDLSARSVTPGLLASLPAEATAVVDAIGLEIEDGGDLWVTGDLSGGGGDAGLVIGFTRASFSLGVPIDRASGTLTVQRGEGGVKGALELESFRAERVPMLAGAAEFEWSPEAGRLDIPVLTALCAGGLVRGEARLAPSVGLAGGEEYFLDVRCADVPLAWVIERPEEGVGSLEGYSQRGLIAGRLTVRGGVGKSGEQRVGRGTFTITGGEVLRLPLLTPVFELVNLQPPMGEELDDAAIEFGLTGDRLVFDRLYVRSDSIVMSAYGEADLGAGTLDLAVRSRGRKRLPVVSDLMDALRDELVGTRITGAIGSPEYSLVQLPNAGRVLLGVLAPGAGGRADRAAAPARPAVAEHVLSTLEPIDE